MFTDHPGTLPEPKAKSKGSVAITAETFAKIQPHKNNADMAMLLLFYTNTARWQDASQVKATTGFTARGLNWTEARVRKAKKDLIELGLIEDINTKEKGKSTGWFVRVNFLPTVVSSQGGSQGDKCSSGKVNALKEKSKQRVSADTPSVSKERIEKLKQVKLKTIQRPRNAPTEAMFDLHLEMEGLEHIMAKKHALYDEIEERKWHEWNDEKLRWERIFHWESYITSFEETIKTSCDKLSNR